MGCSNVNNLKDWSFMELHFVDERQNWEIYPKPSKLFSEYFLFYFFIY